MFLSDSCTMNRMTGPEWKRLAQLVISRRTQLGMKTTKALAEAADLTPRMVSDIENHRRTNYSAGARAQIENALRWKSGSIDAIVTGGEPTPLPEGVGLGVLIPTEPADDEDSPISTDRIVEQGWQDLKALVDAVLGQTNPSSELLAAARRVVSIVSGHLIIDILESGNPKAHEHWLARIYREREQWHQALAPDGEPTPWVRNPERTHEQAAAEAADAWTQETYDDLTTEPPTTTSPTQEDEGKKTPAADGRDHDAGTDPEGLAADQARPNVWRSNPDDLIEPNPASGVDADSHQRDVDLAARTTPGKSKGEQLRDRDTALGEESQDPEDQPHRKPLNIKRSNRS